MANHTVLFSEQAIVKLSGFQLISESIFHIFPCILRVESFVGRYPMYKYDSMKISLNFCVNYDTWHRLCRPFHECCELSVCETEKERAEEIYFRNYNSEYCQNETSEHRIIAVRERRLFRTRCHYCSAQKSHSITITRIHSESHFNVVWIKRQILEFRPSLNGEISEWLNLPV